MKALHLTDGHFRKNWFRWIEDACPSYDVLFLTGDLLDFRSREAGVKEQAKFVSKWLRRLRVPTVVATGNHDGLPHSGILWLRSLQSEKLWIDSPPNINLGVKIQALGWGQTVPTVNAEILLSHAPPAECDAARDRDGIDHGSFDLRCALESSGGRPWLMLCGHVHQPTRYSSILGVTRVVNSSANENEGVIRHTVIKIREKKIETRTAAI